MIDFSNKKVGIRGLHAPQFRGVNIGDSIIYSTYPENFYLNFRNKLIDMDNHWVFDHNPFVVRNQEPEVVIDIHTLIHEGWVHNSKNIFFDNIISRNNFSSDLMFKIFINKPNLYIHTDIKPDENKLAISIKGRSFSDDIPDEIINLILDKYKNYQIYQIGGLNDPIIPSAVNKLGLSIFDTAKVIAESKIFIGVNSGMMHIANCYKNVTKKIIYNNKNASKDQISKASIRIPQDSTYHLAGFDWMYGDNEIYNMHEEDLGITKSYLKI